MTRFASQSGCLISLRNPASSSLASSFPIACRLGSENHRSVCLTGLNPFIMLRLCSASLRGIPGISKGCLAKMSQFSHRNTLKAASIIGSSCAPMAVVGVLGTGVPRLACLRPAAWLLPLELALDFPKEERMMQQSSVSISLSF